MMSVDPETTWFGRDDGAPDTEPTSPTVSQTPGAHPVGDLARDLQWIGPYRLRRVIASGGMGMVFEAEQQSPRRTVALKILRTEMGSRTGPARFEREAQILATLRHPAIAQVYDAGVYNHHGRGVPYFAMELVPDAMPITRHARRAGLSTSEKVTMLASVCDAVQHAHEHDVIHRDLKPDNILVSSDGAVKVIDFGVARATMGALPGSGEVTLHGQLLGTPQYMAPEQAGEHPTADARTDVYALGLVLYELICGERPYEVSSKSILQAARTIRESPVRPPSRVNTALRGDLETVIEKALAKEPCDRYETAGELASDLRRYLDDRPVHARRRGAVSRRVIEVRRGLRRRPLVRALVVVPLVVGLVLGLSRVMPVPGGVSAAHARAAMALAPSVPPGEPFRDVRIVFHGKDTDFGAIARGQDILVPEQGLGRWHTFRPLVGLVLERIARGEPRAVIVDKYFPYPSEYDAALVAGVEALGAVGADVVIGTSPLRMSEMGVPEALREIVRWGSPLAHFSAQHPWAVPLISEFDGRAVPSLALAGLAAYREPGSWAQYELDDRVARVSFYREPGGLQSSERPRTEVIALQSHGEARRVDESSADGTVRGAFMFDVPADETLRDATVSFEALFGATDAELRSWFRGRAVVLGGSFHRATDEHATPDGRTVVGCFGHAAALDALIRSHGYERASRWVEFAVLSLSAVVGLMLAGVSRGWVRWSGVVLIGVVWVVCQVVVQARLGYLLSPVLPPMGLALAAGLTRRIS